MVLLDNVYASLRKGSAPWWWPGQWPLSPVSLFLSLQKNIHIIIRKEKFRIIIQTNIFLLTNISEAGVNTFPPLITLHLFPFSCELVQNNFASSQHFGQVRKTRGKRRLQAIWNTGAGASCLRNRIHHLFYGNSVESSNLPQTKYFNKIQEK